MISLAWAKGSIDVGDPMRKIEKWCEGVPPTPQKSENKFRVIWLSFRKDSHCKPIILVCEWNTYGLLVSVSFYSQLASTFYNSRIYTLRLSSGKTWNMPSQIYFMILFSGDSWCHRSFYPICFYLFNLFIPKTGLGSTYTGCYRFIYWYRSFLCC